MTPRAIGYMHIPKTAGVAVQHVFQQALGADACRTFDRPIVDADFAACRFASGHLWLSGITPHAWRFTFLRHPLAQLASHLRWLDHYNLPEFHAAAQRLPPVSRTLVALVGRTDLTSPASIDRFFDSLPDPRPLPLENFQCEMLTRIGGRELLPETLLAEAAFDRLRELQFVGRTETLDRDIARLFALLDLPPPGPVLRRNDRSSPRRIDLSDPAMRACLAERMRADQALYDRFSAECAASR